MFTVDSCALAVFLCVITMLYWGSWANTQNSIAVAGGANERLSPAHVRKARSVIMQAQVLLLQLETPIKTIEAAARLAAANGVRVILNPAPARALPDRLLRSVSILTPNESEAESLTGTKVKGLAGAQTSG